MSVLQLFSNNAISLLHASLSTSDSALVLQPGQGALFPQPSAPGEFFLVTLEDIASPSLREIIKISGRSGDTLTIEARGVESTVVRNWAADDTLVDHRITAETIRQAFLQPVGNGTPGPKGDPGQDGVDGQDGAPGADGTNGVDGKDGVDGIDGAPGPQGPKGDTGAQGPVGPAGPAGDGGGSSTPPITVEPSWTLNIAQVDYTEFRRGHKFWVTLFSPSNKSAQTFEVLCVIQGDIDANAETVDWTKTNRIGYNFAGEIDVTLDSPNNKLQLTWNNLEAFDVVATIVYI